MEGSVNANAYQQSYTLHNNIKHNDDVWHSQINDDNASTEDTSEKRQATKTNDDNAHFTVKRHDFLVSPFCTVVEAHPIRMSCQGREDEWG